MWIFTVIGFFSIVQKPADSAAGTLTIRARSKGDLQNLREQYLPALGTISHSDRADYRYRATASRADIARAMQRLVMDIDYPNFKNEVERRQGAGRCQIYHDVWDAASGIAE